MGTVFTNLTQKDLHAHFNYIAKWLDAKHRVILCLGESEIEVPIYKRKYKRKADTIGLLIRTSSVGRENLKRILGSLKLQSYDMRIRKSAKLKLISQCAPHWPVDDASFPLHIVVVLKIICQEASQEWPPEITLYYPGFTMDTDLPGTRKNDTLFRVGYKVGYAVGSIVKSL